MESKCDGRVYRNAGNAWAWTILDERRVDIMRGGGYASRDEAFKALVEEFEWLGEKNPAIEPGP